MLLGPVRLAGSTPRNLFLGASAPVDTTKSEEVRAAKLDMENAQATVDRVTATFDKLTLSMSPEDANKAYDQAVASLKDAQDRYTAALDAGAPKA